VEFLGLLDPDPDLVIKVWIRIRLQILLSSRKKNLFDCLSLKNDLSAPLKSNKEKIIF
jgi:hypothetical protein